MLLRLMCCTNDAPSRATVRSSTFLSTVLFASVEVTLESEHGLEVNAVIEILQGPGTARQVAELYSQDGRDRPVSAIVETPGANGSTIIIRNTAPMVYPLTASVRVVARKDPRAPDLFGAHHDQEPWMVLGGGGGAW